MLIDRIYLRNYRVFADELELFLPPGLVGVYGPNGAGKSSLLESILWALWGRARTPKEDIRTSGSGGECVSEITFEQEGHIYFVRRAITGVNSTVKAEAQCDGRPMAQGAKDTSRYVHSVLGMDDAAFRASVFAEQKQLAAFSAEAPAQRRKLVLSLLGVTPLDSARDQARSDARALVQQHERLRGVLPDLNEARVRSSDSEARAAAAEVVAADAERAAVAAEDALARAEESFTRLDLVRQHYERLVIEGRGARSELDGLVRAVDELQAELGELATDEARLADLDREASKLPEAEAAAATLVTFAAAFRDLAKLPAAAPPPVPDEHGLAAASQKVMNGRSALASAEAFRDSAVAEVGRCRQTSARSSELSADKACPLCGQELGAAFLAVQDHRAAELTAALDRLGAAEVALKAASGSAQRALDQWETLDAQMRAAQAARAGWEQLEARRADALGRLAQARDGLSAVGPQLLAALDPEPQLEQVELSARRLAEEVAAGREAQKEAVRLRGRLERRPRAEEALRETEERRRAASSLVEALREKVKALDFDDAQLEAAKASWADASELASQARKSASAARLGAVQVASSAAADARSLAEAQEQHGRLAELESESLCLGRTAELLNAFRNSVVASVGPRLALQAGELFGQLTDNEYDRLELDPDTYGLRISDGGTAYDLDRFSGSEVDLANLALRVAISEHVRFQSGGSVGLLVLDEVFGPLDEERKTRMLLALERLRGRFRQILVVTHSTDIKEQLPDAIEVQKLPGRRATARALGAAGGR